MLFGPIRFLLFLKFLRKGGKFLQIRILPCKCSATATLIESLSSVSTFFKPFHQICTLHFVDFYFLWKNGTVISVLTLNVSFSICKKFLQAFPWWLSVAKMLAKSSSWRGSNHVQKAYNWAIHTLFSSIACSLSAKTDTFTCIYLTGASCRIQAKRLQKDGCKIDQRFIRKRTY